LTDQLAQVILPIFIAFDLGDMGMNMVWGGLWMDQVQAWSLGYET
jgi:hypothetical protein